MNRVLVACVLVVVVFAACAKSKPPRPGEASQPPPGALAFHDDGVDMRKRLSGYLGSKVTPEFRDCWSKVKGEGALAIDIEFRKAEKTWVFDRIVVQQSSLAKGQDVVAMGCLESAVRGTSFPVDPNDALEAAGPRMLARQGWPVPLPPEGERLPPNVVARRFGSGDAPGEITVKGCSKCVDAENPPPFYKCESRDSDSGRDCEEKPPNGCAITPEPCVKDVIVAIHGGIIIF